MKTLIERTRVKHFCKTQNFVSLEFAAVVFHLALLIGVIVSLLAKRMIANFYVFYRVSLIEVCFSIMKSLRSALSNIYFTFCNLLWENII